MKDRLVELMRLEGLSAARLAEIAGVQPSTVSHVLSGRNKPSFDFLSSIMAHYPTLNARWLMLGAGEMYDPVGAIPEPTHHQIDNVIDKKTSADKHVEKVGFFYADGTFEMYNGR